VSLRERYEAIWEAVPEGQEPSDFRARREFLLSAVGSGDRVLDLGCGEGVFAGELAGAGADVLGVDVASEPLRRAALGYPQLELQLIDGDGAWELEDSAFDVVWAGEVIEHVADTAAWLSEVRRVLRSGGTLLLSTPACGRLAMLRAALSSDTFAERFDPLSDHLRFYSRRTLTDLLREFGFEHVSVRAAGGRRGSHGLLLASATRSRF
jgi:2-polyprenyl-3-methyl-5-hydroxy-6-metoxy-1,4-benzoquinol methylase